MRLKIQGLIISSVLVLAVGFAAAQSNQAGDFAPPTDLRGQQDVSLTPQEMVKKADEHLARMDQGARGVRTQLTQARQERDVVKVLCLNDKLNQIDVALASAGDRQASLESLAKANEVDRARHEFTIISVLRERVETLVSEANQCVGEELGYLGDTEVEVTVDPDIADTDPSEFPDEPFIGEPPTFISEPPAASPTS